MTRLEAWRSEYLLNRYLKSASVADIEQRSRDVALNMLNVSDAGKLTPGVIDESLPWWELWNHILIEIELREIDYMTLDLMDLEAMRWVNYPEIPRGLKLLKGRQLPKKRFFARMGQKDHLIASLENGRFRIAPATSYSDPSLNPAIRDEELSVTAVRSGDAVAIRRYNPVTNKYSSTMYSAGEICLSSSTPDNFFVLCMSNTYVPRLLDDFEADALLIIHNIDRFLVRLRKAAKLVQPDLNMYARSVTYYDPYRVIPDALEPEFSKNFRYAYQEEFRIVWHKPGLSFAEEPFFVEIGTMRDVASLFVSNERGA